MVSSPASWQKRFVPKLIRELCVKLAIHGAHIIHPNRYPKCPMWEHVELSFVWNASPNYKKIKLPFAYAGLVAF